MSNKQKLVQVTRKEFEEALNEGRTAFMKKPRSWKKYHYTYTDLKDPWFIRWEEDNRKGKDIEQDTIGLITTNDLDSHCRMRLAEGYSFYI